MPISRGTNIQNTRPSALRCLNNPSESDSENIGECVIEQRDHRWQHIVWENNRLWSAASKTLVCRLHTIKGSRPVGKDVESRVPLTILFPFKPSTQILPFFLKIILVVPTVAKVHLNPTFRRCRCRISRRRANGDRELALV
jgi:hypothetical protein